MLEICTGIAAGLLLYRNHRKYIDKLRTYSQKLWRRTSEEEQFVRQWTEIISQNIKVYNGMLSSMERVADGTAKRPEKVIEEWCIRTSNTCENESLELLCEKTLMPAVKSANAEECKKWANLLLKSVKSAGIQKDKSSELTLTDMNVKAYIDWEGTELYSGDRVKIITPAWYENGFVVEQGTCKIIRSDVLTENDEQN